jgi:hypothetical protein
MSLFTGDAEGRLPAGATDHENKSTTDSARNGCKKQTLAAGTADLGISAPSLWVSYPPTVDVDAKSRSNDDRLTSRTFCA